MNPDSEEMTPWKYSAALTLPKRVNDLYLWIAIEVAVEKVVQSYGGELKYSTLEENSNVYSK